MRMLLAAFMVSSMFGLVIAGPEEELQRLFSEAWQNQLEEDPLFATAVGDHRYNDRLPGVSNADQLRRFKANTAFLARLKTIDPDVLVPAERINYQLFQRLLEDRLAYFEYKAYQIPLNADSGFHSELASIPSQMPFRNKADFERYIKRLQAFLPYVMQQIDQMRAGLSSGMTLPRSVLNGIEVGMAAHLVDAPEKSIFFKPFATIPSSFAEHDRKRLQSLGKKAVAEKVIPAFRQLFTFITKEYVPNARKTLAASDLPNGKAYYQQRVAFYTTMDIDYEAVHQIGLKEVARIRAEMAAIIESLDFKGSFADFLKFLRTDSRFYPKTADELLQQAAYIAKTVDAKLPAFFSHFPRLPYGVAPVPEHLAPKYTAGRYVEPALGSTEPGYYWVNTYALESRPLYNLEALTLHEAVPGHHFQISLAREMVGVPEFRRFSYISAFGEGWGLYAEYLGTEMGLYQDPYSKFGKLTYEMWRACRLVVDTGLHGKGWTRQRAIDYLASHTALSLHECTTETDRYISWPAQALSYKMGELKIRELRAKAEQTMGANFDLRRFHDALLAQGSVTLPILEQIVQDFIAQGGQSTGQASSP